MFEYLQSLFPYNSWANEETVHSLSDTLNPPQHGVRTIGHIVGAERLWLSRLRNEPSQVAVWPDFTLDKCKSDIGNLDIQWKAYLEDISEDKLLAAVIYLNSNGEKFTNTVQDILMHVITHSGYHRGQIAADLRQAGFKPAYTDYIHYVRQVAKSTRS